jgi:hypothetical protein
MLLTIACFLTLLGCLIAFAASLRDWHRRQKPMALRAGEPSVILCLIVLALASGGFALVVVSIHL